MTDKQKVFELASILVERMKEHRQTATLKFKDMNEKKSIADVYKFIYPGVVTNLSCDSCVLQYLNLITVWYSREHPIYLKSIEEVKPTVPDSLKLASLNLTDAEVKRNIELAGITLPPTFKKEDLEEQHERIEKTLKKEKPIKPPVIEKKPEVVKYTVDLPDISTIFLEQQETNDTKE